MKDTSMQKYNHPQIALFRRVFITLTSFAILTAAHAQVPTMISYQGRVIMNGTNFTGAGQFKFALVQGAGPTLLWKNDGSAGNTEPASAVSLSVANGLVMTSLGDTALPNMTAIPTSVFNNSDVRLRVWFNGGSGSQQLTPDQRIVSVGYALMSATVPDGSITLAKLAPGVMNPTNFPANSVSSNQLADIITLGTSNVNGRLDVYRTAANTPSISLIGSGNQISTYGSDGLEQIRLWGPTYGELLLNNSAANNATTVRLSAQSTAGGTLELRNTNGSSRAVLDGENTGGLLTLYQSDGGVGAVLDGDSGGAGYLSLRGTNGSSRAILDASDSGGGALRLYENDGTQTAAFTAEGNGVINLYQGDGSVGIGMSANNGTGGGGLSVYSDTGSFAAQLTVADGTRRDGFLGLANSSGVNRLYARVWNGATASAYLGMVNSAGTQTITLDSDASGDGRVTTQVLQITGGSDLSENFNINETQAEPGMIVSIDPSKPGELVLSREAYDHKVAGIVSGAGGVKPGMLMGQAGTKADGKHPIALTGRVYCWVDASHGSVVPGDMITTSPTPGHGMKAADRDRAFGSIIGKAMTGLDNGKGLVLVLVSLQ